MAAVRLTDGRRATTGREWFAWTARPPSGSSQRCLVNADEGPAGIASTLLVMLQPVCEPELYQRLASHAEAMRFPVDRADHPCWKIHIDPPLIQPGTASLLKVEHPHDALAVVECLVKLRCFHRYPVPPFRSASLR